MFAGGLQPVGSDDSNVYDNERPAGSVVLTAFRLGPAPISNGAWLGFMNAGGYTDTRWWSPAGQAWLVASGARHPQHWRPATDGGWVSADPDDPLLPDSPVHGINALEADAFARWAGARLPHEHEWEHAAISGRLTGQGQIWEWCSNTLHPYAGFRAHPYEGYSTPWFDGLHRVLRGSSRHTRVEIRRPSFRNFYPATHRHVFAGLRLAD